jgi:hypothetical protein
MQRPCAMRPSVIALTRLWSSLCVSMASRVKTATSTRAVGRASLETCGVLDCAGACRRRWRLTRLDTVTMRRRLRSERWLRPLENGARRMRINAMWRVTFVCWWVALGSAGCLPDGSGEGGEGSTKVTTDTSEDVDAGCARDSECERGTVCRVGMCQAVSCSSKVDCGANRACIPNQWVCTGVECVFSDECDEASGEVCAQGLCLERAPGYCEYREDCAITNQICNALAQECVDPPASCSSHSDCVAPSLCNPITRSCSDLVTMCESNSECSAAQYCDVGLNQCRDGCRVDSCGEDFRCDLGTRACVPEVICTPSVCEARGGQACHPQTGLCVERTGSASLCEACTPGSTTECGAPGLDRCTPLGVDGGRCVYRCQDQTECPSGFGCVQISSSPERFCAPINGRCQGCLLEGCPSDQVCNPNGECSEAKAVCEACSPGLCAAGLDCAEIDNSARCLALCDGGCPQGTTCDTASNLCRPDSGSCEASVCPGVTCSGATPYLDAQTCACVACLDSGDCGGNQCDSGVCTSCACPPGTACGANNACIPIGGGGCDSCPAGTTCDTVTQTCYTPGACATDSDCRVRCGAFGACACSGETDTTSCRPDEYCLGFEIIPGLGESMCFVSGAP